MRSKALVGGDIRFQFKYGFYFLYMVFCALYIGLLFALPAGWRQTAAVLLVFSDPAAMGLYFMGAIVLFEKGERVLDSLAVSPVKPAAYVLSKLLSIAVISTAAALVIGFSAGAVPDAFLFAAGVLLGSCLFSSVGLMVAARARTLNGFMLRTIPAELLIAAPAGAYLLGWKPVWLLLHPGVCVIELCAGGALALPALGVLLIWAALAAAFACRAVTRMLGSLGGISL